MPSSTMCCPGVQSQPMEDRSQRTGGLGRDLSRRGQGSLGAWFSFSMLSYRVAIVGGLAWPSRNDMLIFYF